MKMEADRTFPFPSLIIWHSSEGVCVHPEPKLMEQDLSLEMFLELAEIYNQGEQVEDKRAVEKNLNFLYWLNTNFLFYINLKYS